MGSQTAASLPLGRLAGVGLIVFLANAAMLVLQLVAGRLLAPFVGSSLETWTSIIGVFLLGIALGNALGGRLADRYPSPRTLAIVLAFGAITAVWMVMLPAVLASTGAYKSIPLGPRIPVLALVLCLPAGFVLSLLTPLAIKLGLPDVAHTGRVAGMVFALSTLGCLLGNYLTGFVLMPAFTINTLTYAAAGALAVLAAGAMVFLRETRGPGETQSTAQQTSSQQTPPDDRANEAIPRPANPHAFPDIRLAYLIVFLASFGGMTLELTASRVLAQQLGVSLFTWTGIIGVMLAGTAIGNFLGGLFADRAAQPGGMRRPLAWLAAFVTGLFALWLVHQGLPWVCSRFEVKLGLSGTVLLLVAATTAAVAGFGVYHAVVRLTDEFVNPRTMLAVTLMSAGAGTVLLFIVRTVLVHSTIFSDIHPIAQVIGWTFSLFFLPMLVLGMVSPQVIRLSVPDVAHAGRVAGRVYAWSTAGAIVGTFAAGYVLISSLGMDRTLLGVSLVLTLTSLLVAKVWDSNPMLYLFSVVLGGVCGGFILTGKTREEGVVGKLETNYYTIKVTARQRADGELSSIRVLTLDHLIHSEVDLERPEWLHYEHEHIQVEFLWAARVGAANPRALVIGGGGYTFPRYAMEILPETRMDVVEIDPGVTKVAREHLGLKEYDGLNITHMDGRQYVAERVPPGTYDLVVQDAVNDLSVPSHLLTKEYNDAVKRTLKSDGVYLLTVIDSIKYGRLWRSAMRTLKESFAHVELVSSVPVPPETPPSGATEDELKEWRSSLRSFETARHVLVIYAADRPIDVEAIRKEAYQRMEFMPKAVSGAVEGLTRKGPAAVAVFAAAHTSVRCPFYTHLVPARQLAPFFAADPGVLLTDQFAPVDNLMAEVFRYRYTARPEDEE